jgi:hypothetical protein
VGHSALLDHLENICGHELGHDVPEVLDHARTFMLPQPTKPAALWFHSRNKKSIAFLPPGGTQGRFSLLPRGAERLPPL